MKRIIWCPVRGWKSEAWCIEVRDPQKYGPCYHCMYGARGQWQYVEKTTRAGAR